MYSSIKSLAVAMALAISVAGLTPITASDLVITGVVDGPLSGGVPKAVELCVLADIPDLSAYGIGSANNGGGSDGEEFTFPAGPASAGTFLYVASEASGFSSFFGFAPTHTSGAAAINGDDAIELFMSGGVVDLFGDINVDGTGEAWEYLDGWAYRDDGTGPDGTSFVLANWSFSGPNASTARPPTPPPRPRSRSAPTRPARWHRRRRTCCSPKSSSPRRPESSSKSTTRPLRSSTSPTST